MSVRPIGLAALSRQFPAWLGLQVSPDTCRARLVGSLSFALARAFGESSSFSCLYDIPIAGYCKHYFRIFSPNPPQATPYCVCGPVVR